MDRRAASRSPNSVNTIASYSSSPCRTAADAALRVACITLRALSGIRARARMAATIRRRTPQPSASRCIVSRRSIVSTSDHARATSDRRLESQPSSVSSHSQRW